MKGFLGTKAELPADITLMVQAVVFLILLTGFTYARGKKFDTHGRIMATAVALSGITLVTWMIPTLIDSFGILVKELATRGKFYSAAIVTVLHVALGSSAAALSLYIITRMSINLPASIRVKNIRRLMRVTLVVWTATFLMGTYLYYSLYL